MCKVSNKILADYLVNSLNPHWVSWVFIPKRTVMTNLNTALMNRRWNFRWTLPYYYMWRLEPTVITKGWPVYFTSYYSLDQTLSKSENVVAPSASTIRILSPWAIDMPALTAPPLPLFLGYSTTTKVNPNYFALSRATYVVLSLEPSFAIII